LYLYVIEVRGVLVEVKGGLDESETGETEGAKWQMTFRTPTVGLLALELRWCGFSILKSLGFGDRIVMRVVLVAFR
jgi:hypothetical protein